MPIERFGELQDGKTPKPQVTEQKKKSPRKYDPDQAPSGYNPAVWALMRNFVAQGYFWAREDLEPKKFIVYQRLDYCLEKSGMDPEEHYIIQAMFMNFWTEWDGEFDPIEQMFGLLTWDKYRRIVLLQEEAREIKLKALAAGEGQTPAEYHPIDRETNPAEKPRHKLGQPTMPGDVTLGEWPDDVKSWIERNIPREEE